MLSVVAFRIVWKDTVSVIVGEALPLPSRKDTAVRGLRRIWLMIAVWPTVSAGWVSRGHPGSPAPTTRPQTP